MSTVTYLYDPNGPLVFVLIPGTCSATYVVSSASINRVEITVVQATPTPITTIEYVVTLSSDASVHVVAESEVFADKPSAVAEAVTRYQVNFA
jgi:hypothetical protein